MKLPPLIRWPGGQSREARRLEKVFPEHEHYVEPFAGGSSFFFHKDLAEGDNVLGDTSKWLIPFYDDSRRGKLRRCQKGVRYSPRTYERALRGRSACDRLAVSAMGFAGQRSGFDKSRARSGTKFGTLLYKGKLKKLEEYESKLASAYLTTGSFERTMKKFDSSSTWHLLDPPWPGVASTNQYEGGLTVEPEQVAKTCRQMKGTVWVLYNDTPQIREAFSDFHQYRMSTKVMHLGKGMQDYKKLLLTNEPIGRGSKGVRKLQGLDGLGQYPKHISRGAQTAATVLGTLTALNLALLVNRPGKPDRVIIGKAIAGTAVGYMATAVFSALLGAWEGRKR